MTYRVVHVLYAVTGILVLLGVLHKKVSGLFFLSEQIDWTPGLGNIL